MTVLPAPAAAVRRVVLVLVLVLCVLFVVWHAQRFSVGTATLAGVLGVAPWLAPLRGLQRGSRRTYAATTLLTLPYLGYGLMETLANPGARVYAAATVLTAFALFVALIAFLRVSRPALPAPSERTAP